jgi:hypothetical protein
MSHCALIGIDCMRMGTCDYYKFVTFIFINKNSTRFSMNLDVAQ